MFGHKPHLLPNSYRTTKIQQHSYRNFRLRVLRVRILKDEFALSKCLRVLSMILRLYHRTHEQVYNTAYLSCSGTV